MFSPSVAQGGPATATRSRRRQRPLSSEHVAQQPKAKRQRVPLTEQTFVNPDAQQDMIEVKTDGKVATLPAKNKNKNIEPPESPSPVLRKELNVRAKKAKHGDRAANKGDGSLVLVRIDVFYVAMMLLHINGEIVQTSTNAYCVSKLPALPDRIRTDWSGKSGYHNFSSRKRTHPYHHSLPNCRHLPHRLCSFSHPNTCPCLALHVDIAITRNFFLQPPINVQTQ